MNRSMKFGLPLLQERDKRVRLLSRVQNREVSEGLLRRVTQQTMNRITIVGTKKNKQMLELKGIYKWVNTGVNRTFILKDVDLSVKQGEFISIMGPSGSGKSTLLNVVGMLDDFNEGEYHFMHESVHKLKEKQRSALYKQYIGFVFQAYHLIDELTVYENIETPLIYQNIKTSERKAMVADILDRFQIVGKKDLFPTQLSGGQQQLVGIARALIAKPKLILADEPTGNLNSKQGEEIMDLFKQLNTEDHVTIIQVTHSEKNAAYGSRIVHLLDGRIEKEEASAAMSV